METRKTTFLQGFGLPELQNRAETLHSWSEAVLSATEADPTMFPTDQEGKPGTPLFPQGFGLPRLPKPSLPGPQETGRLRKPARVSFQQSWKTRRTPKTHFCTRFWVAQAPKAREQMGFLA